jgi:hypothetical protein
MRGRSAFEFGRVGVLIALVLGPAFAFAQGSLRITTNSLPKGIAGSTYQTAIVATGAAPPYAWQLVDGKLPTGLKLSASRGTIAGAPSSPGDYKFTVAVTDSGVPAQRIVKTYLITVTAALTIEWKSGPAVHDQQLEGSMVVTNLADQDVVITVIVMAVNQIGRATALGYQEFTMRAGAEQVIPFGSSPGPGTYIVHADAVAEVARTNSIYRARKQTAQQLVIQTPE